LHSLPPRKMQDTASQRSAVGREDLPPVVLQESKFMLISRFGRELTGQGLVLRSVRLMIDRMPNTSDIQPNASTTQSRRIRAGLS
jgi:hypothetical protein